MGSLWARLGCVVIAVAIVLAQPFIGGVYYSLCGDHADEQDYLDLCISRLKVLRAHTADPDLQDVLDYAIRRYHKVGAWDVIFCPLTGNRVIGCNCPWCPGITLDDSLLLGEPEDAALTIAHEAMHDYFPYFGHAHVTPRENKLKELSRCCPSPKTL